MISQTNQAGARLLGLERVQLKGNRFRAFVAGGDLPDFDSFLRKVFAAESECCCEMQLAIRNQPPRTVRVEAIRMVDGQECRAVVVDITGRKAAETDLRRVNQHLDQLVSERTKLLAVQLENVEKIYAELVASNK